MKRDDRTSIPILSSQVVIGQIITALVVIIGLFGVDVTETQEEQLIKGVIAALVLLGNGVSIYGRATTKGARPLEFRLPKIGGGGAAMLALLCLASAPVLTSCATLGANLDRAERSTDVGDALVNAAEEAGLITASTAGQVRGYIASARTAIRLARTALELGNRAEAEQLVRDALAAIKGAEDGMRYAAPPERQPIELNEQIAALKAEADELASKAAR